MGVKVQKKRIQLYTKSDPILIPMNINVLRIRASTIIYGKYYRINTS